MGLLIPRHFIKKFQNTEDEEKILKPPERKEKNLVTYKRSGSLHGIKLLIRNFISHAPAK